MRRLSLSESSELMNRLMEEVTAKQKSIMIGVQTPGYLFFTMVEEGCLQNNNSLFRDNKGEEGKEGKMECEGDSTTKSSNSLLSYPLQFVASQSSMNDNLPLQNPSTRTEPPEDQTDQNHKAKSTLRNMIVSFKRFCKYLTYTQTTQIIQGIPLSAKIAIPQGYHKKSSFQNPYLQHFFDSLQRDKKQRRRNFLNSNSLVEISNCEILRPLMIFWLQNVADYWISCYSKITKRNLGFCRKCIPLFLLTVQTKRHHKIPKRLICSKKEVHSVHFPQCLELFNQQQKRKSQFNRIQEKKGLANRRQKPKQGKTMDFYSFYSFYNDYMERMDQIQEIANQINIVPKIDTQPHPNVSPPIPAPSNRTPASPSLSDSIFSHNSNNYQPFFQLPSDISPFPNPYSSPFQQY